MDFSAAEWLNVQRFDPGFLDLLNDDGNGQNFAGQDD